MLAKVKDFISLLLLCNFPDFLKTKTRIFFVFEKKLGALQNITMIYKGNDKDYFEVR